MPYQNQSSFEQPGRRIFARLFLRLGRLLQYLHNKLELGKRKTRGVLLKELLELWVYFLVQGYIFSSTPSKWVLLKAILGILLTALSLGLLRFFLKPLWQCARSSWREEYQKAIKESNFIGEEEVV